MFKKFMAAGDCLLMTGEYDHMRKTAIISREIRNLMSHFLTHKFSNRHKVLTLYRMVFFRAAHRSQMEEGGGKKGTHPKICHSYPTYNDETSHSCTLPKEDPKYI